MIIFSRDLKKKSILKNSVPVSGLYFAQEKPLVIGPGSELQDKIVNVLYDIQNWHNQYDIFTLDERVDKLRLSLGAEICTINTPHHGKSIVWICSIKDHTYILMQTATSLMVETLPETLYTEVLSDLKVLKKKLRSL
jgi:anthranilate/para-aminobenzoate synthase component II